MQKPDARAAEAALGRRLGDEWIEPHGVEAAHLVAVERELAERRVAERAVLRALAVDPRKHVLEAIGYCPDSLAGREEWARAAAEIEDSRERFGAVPDFDSPPGVDPLEQAAWGEVRDAVVAARAPELPVPFEPEPPPLDPELEVDDFDLGP